MSTVEKKPSPLDVYLSALPDEKNIRLHANFIWYMRERLALTEKALAEMVARFQEACETDGHGDMEKVMQHVKDSPYYKDDNILLGWKCKRCLKFVARPTGYPWEICYKCGGKMKFEGIVPGQGSRLYGYVCGDCGHEYAHT